MATDVDRLFDQVMEQMMETAHVAMRNATDDEIWKMLGWTNGAPSKGGRLGGFLRPSWRIDLEGRMYREIMAITIFGIAETPEEAVCVVKCMTAQGMPTAGMDKCILDYFRTQLEEWPQVTLAHLGPNLRRLPPSHFGQIAEGMGKLFSAILS